jgi:hypothetical protein
MASYCVGVLTTGYDDVQAGDTINLIAEIRKP